MPGSLFSEKSKTFEESTDLPLVIKTSADQAQRKLRSFLPFQTDSDSREAHRSKIFTGFWKVARNPDRVVRIGFITPGSLKISNLILLYKEIVIHLRTDFGGVGLVSPM
jgi:hypothetical protein